MIVMMKVGDLVHDASLGMSGVIVGMATVHSMGTWRWVILYEDGQTDEAYDNELEVISESR